MTPTWSPAELAALGAAVELEIAVRGADGVLGPWTPVWVVRVGTGAYVRSWHRRETGWFGQAVRLRRARVRVPGLVADVTVDDVGGDEPGLRAAVDAAYRAAYGDEAAASMVTAGAAATTLRLDPDR